MRKGRLAYWPLTAGESEEVETQFMDASLSVLRKRVREKR
jgi:hypothetical protein